MNQQHLQTFHRAAILLCGLLLVQVTATAQRHKPAYALYNAAGKEVSYEKLVKAAAAADLVLFGEIHNNAIAHWMQLELTKDLRTRRPLVLGAEMFEADDQAALDRYLTGDISIQTLDSLADLWPNYPTDYAPLVELAKQYRIPFVATNVPRRYASQVFRGGFEALEALSPAERAWVAPLPVAYDATLPGYAAMLGMMGEGHGGDNFPKAQAIKDATMGHFIAQAMRPDTTFVHFNGAYHSDNFEGILWYVKRLKPAAKTITITTVSQAEVGKLEAEYRGRADFILVVDADMTDTYEG